MTDVEGRSFRASLYPVAGASVYSLSDSMRFSFSGIVSSMVPHYVSHITPWEAWMSIRTPCDRRSRHCRTKKLSAQQPGDLTA